MRLVRVFLLALLLLNLLFSFNPFFVKNVKADTETTYFIPDNDISINFDNPYNTTYFIPNSDDDVHLDRSGVPTNSAMVDDPIGSPDEQSTTVSTTGTNYDIYSIPNHTTESGIITNIRVYIRTRCSSLGNVHKAYCAIKHSETIYYGSANLVQTTWTNNYYDWDVRPNDAQPWTWDDIDNLGIGVKLEDLGSFNPSCTQVYLMITYFDTHYNMVDDNNSGYPVDAYDDDTTKIESDSVYTRTDVFSMNNHTSEIGIISNIRIYVRCRSGSLGNARCVLRTNNTNYYGTEETIYDTYANYYYDWNVNPFNSLPWTWTDVDNLGIGVNSSISLSNIYCTQVYAKITYIPINPPTNITANLYGDYLNITWTLGSGADTTIIRSKIGSYPTNITDGTLCQNNSLTYYNSTHDNEIYFSFWSYNSTYNYYPAQANLTYGGLLVNCFDETNGSNLTFNILVSNYNGSETYSKNGAVNTEYIDVSVCPQGSIIVYVTSTGYSGRTYYMTIYENNWYTLDAYLPLETPPGGGGDCSLRTYYDSSSIASYLVDKTIYFTYTLEDMISVEVWNSSLYGVGYGGWYFVSSDKYSYNTTQVIINKTVLDINTTIARVNYYYLYCPGDIESLLYLLNVIDDYNQPINNVLITIKKYVSDSFVTVSSIYSDGYGQANVYLTNDTLYKIYLECTYYVSVVYDYIPDYNVRSKTFKMSYSFVVNDTYEFWNIIIFNATMYTNGTIKVCYVDSKTNTTDASFYTFERYNSTLTLKATNITSSDSFSFWVNGINDSRTHIIVLYLNHTNLGFVTKSIILSPVNTSITFITDSIETKTSNVFGSFTPGYVNFFLLYLPFIVIIVLSAPFNVGAGIIGGALWLGGAARFITVPTEVLILIPLIIALGVLLMIVKGGKIHL